MLPRGRVVSAWVCRPGFCFRKLRLLAHNPDRRRHVGQRFRHQLDVVWYALQLQKAGLGRRYAVKIVG